MTKCAHSLTTLVKRQCTGRGNIVAETVKPSSTRAATLLRTETSSASAMSALTQS